VIWYDQAHFKPRLFVGCSLASEWDLVSYSDRVALVFAMNVSETDTLQWADWSGGDQFRWIRCHTSCKTSGVGNSRLQGTEVFIDSWWLNVSFFQETEGRYLTVLADIYGAATLHPEITDWSILPHWKWLPIIVLRNWRQTRILDWLPLLHKDMI